MNKRSFKSIGTKYRIGFAVAMSSAVTVVLAQEQPVQATDNSWHGQGELGYVRTTGNTNTRTMGAKFGLDYQRRVWRYAGRLEALSSVNQDIQIAERYFLGFKVDYALEDRDYLAVIFEYEDERFAVYDYRFNHTLAYGRKFVNRPSLILDGELGVGGRRGREESGAKQDDATFRVAANMKWTISPSASLAEEFSVVAGKDDTTTRSITGLTSRINGRFSTKLSYLAKRTSRVSAGVDTTDTETTMTLVYSF